MKHPFLSNQLRELSTSDFDLIFGFASVGEWKQQYNTSSIDEYDFVSMVIVEDEDVAEYAAQFIDIGI